MPGRVDVSGIADVERRLAQFPGDLERELKRAMNEAGRLAVNAVRARLATEIPANPPAGMLRATLARNTSSRSIANGVQITQDARGVRGRNAERLLRRLNAPGIFSHPVYGGPGRATQRGWEHFDKPIREQAAKYRQLCADALDAAIDTIER